MAMSISPKWYEWAYELEKSHNGPIGAGIMAHQFEKIVEDLQNPKKRHLAPLNFYCFIHFSRRKRGQSLNDLAHHAGVEFDELIALERDTQFKLSSASVLKLAKYFGVDKNALLSMARLDKPHFDSTWEEAPRQFPDRVGTTEELSKFELTIVDALEIFLTGQVHKANL